MATQNLTNENFDEALKNNNIVILDFFAPWCPHCRQFGPVFEKSSEKHPEVLFGMVNVEQETELKSRFGVGGIPTIIAFREGTMVYSQPGALTEDKLDNLVKKISEADMEEVRKEADRAE
ncbi:MAG: thioredoxin family protein [bacterium]